MKLLSQKMYSRAIYLLWALGGIWEECAPMGMFKVQYADARNERYPQGISDLLRALSGDLPSLAIAPLSVKPPAPNVQRRNPYKGLEAFKEKDSGDFFGRTAMIAALREKFAERANSQKERFLAVIGASGSGKSSVVMAGVLPQLKQGKSSDSKNWKYVAPMTPGNSPIRNLSRVLYSLFPEKTMAAIDEELWHPSGMGLMRLADVFTEKVVLYVDQFEEIFMPNISEDERQQFISLLVTAVNEMNGSLAAILTMRADFYDRPMNYRDLGELISKHQYWVLPMTLAELREAVENPAALSDVGLAFEPGLVGEIVFDLRDQKDKGVLAGALPLLQFTLKQLYELRDTSEAIHVLTFDAYRSMGGVNNAIGSHAETVFSQLDSDAQAALGRVFIHLVNVNERGEATRKRAPMAQWGNDADAWQFIYALVDAC